MVPLVSVIVPIFNAERWLAATLDSVRAQSWPRIELILVDDGSRDGSAEIARRHGGPDSRLIQQENAGIGAAREAGRLAASGDYITYLDADDLINPEKLELQVHRLQREPGCVACCEWGRFDGAADPETARFIPEPVWADGDPVAWLSLMLGGGGMMQEGVWVLPRDVSDRAGAWPTVRSLNEGGEYFTRAVLASGGVRFVAGARVYYRTGIGGHSVRRNPVTMDGTIGSLESITKHLLAREDSARTRAALATAYARLAYELYPEFADRSRMVSAMAARLGPSSFAPPRGGRFGAVSRVLGWKLARRLQWLYHRSLVR